MDDTQSGQERSQLRVERQFRHEGFAVPPPLTGGGVRQVEGVWLECADGRAGGLEPWMVAYLTQGPDSETPRIDNVPYALLEELDVWTEDGVDRYIGGRIAAILKEAEDE